MSTTHSSRPWFQGQAAAGILLALVLLIPAGPIPVAAQDRNSSESKWSGLSVDYTGSLFGYYRIEPDGLVTLEPPGRFITRHRKRNNSLLLGMGDNFGPEFGSSVQRELSTVGDCALPAPPDQSRPSPNNGAPEVLYKTSFRLPKKAECDNVARFLMEAGYRAVVPGKEDFLYSAEWLRRTALSLQAASGVTKDALFPERDFAVENHFGNGNNRIDNQDHALLMLAANLRLNYTTKGSVEGSTASSWFLKEKLSENVKRICPLLFSWELPSNDLEKCVSGDQQNAVTTEMDWLRRLDVSVQANAQCKLIPSEPERCFPLARSMNMRAQGDITFRRQLLENQTQIAAATLTPKITHQIEKIIIKPEDLGGCAAYSKRTRHTSDGPSNENDKHAFQNALEVLGGNRAFSALKDNTQLKLSPEGECQKEVLEEVIKRLPDRSPDPADAETVEDLKQLLGDLLQSFTNATSNGADFLMSPNARKAAIRLLLRKIAAEQTNIGYTIVKSGSNNGTLVIGVVGQETMKAVSPENLRLCTPTEGSEPKDQSCQKVGSKPRVEGRVVVGDPLFALTAVLRAAWQGRNAPETKFDKVIVMAQMPRTEAEELAAHAAASLKNTACFSREIRATPDAVACPDDIAAQAPRIDLVLSEAQTVHTTPDLELTYAFRDTIPVLAPKRAGDMNRAETDLIDPLSNVSITGQPGDGKRKLVNCQRPAQDGSSSCDTGPEAPAGSPRHLDTMAELIFQELTQVARWLPSIDLDNLKNFWNRCQLQKACQESVLTQFLLEQIHRSSHADVVLLEYRDLYYGPLLSGYGNYAICKEWIDNQRNPKNPLELAAYCRLRIALDRILWKGDYSERVVVDGKTLEQMLKASQQETDDEQSLVARDTVHEWLMTFGIVRQLPTNLSAASMGPATFAIPGVKFCTDPGADSEASRNCVNGQRLAEDGAYFVSTSDHLAEDDQVYKLLKNLDPKYRIRKKDFLTGEIADEIFRYDRPDASEKLVNAPDAYIGMRKVEELNQKRPILQIDFAKWVAGFMLRRPNRSNTQLAADFAGVTDTRATTPSAQELDVEALARVTSGVGVSRLSERLKLGVQSDLEYDRAVTGTLDGSPEVVTYALNSFTTGGFLQVRLHGILSPRLFLVVAPYQYQTQITGNFLNLRLASGSGQITVSTPRSDGFSDRLGARYEFAGHLADSYAEGGPEYSNINNVLSGLGLPNGAVCQVSPTVPLSTCVAHQIAVSSTTRVTPLTESLHTGGLYWDVHLQWAPNKTKRWSLILDTKGDNFLWPGATLPTQSRYAFTTTEALNFKVIGNLQLSPSYSQFFYRNQEAASQSHSLITKTFSVVARWYFARDAAVPWWRQLLFQGPASVDQTKTAKMH